MVAMVVVVTVRDVVAVVLIVTHSTVVVAVVAVAVPIAARLRSVLEGRHTR